MGQMNQRDNRRKWVSLPAGITLFVFACFLFSMNTGYAQTNTFPANGYVGIGTTIPGFALTMFGTDWNSSQVSLTTFAGTPTPGGTDNYTPQFRFEKARGTSAASVKVEDEDRIGAFLAAGHDGVKMQRSAVFGFRVDGPTNVGLVPIGFFVQTGDNSANKPERFLISSAGKVVINDLIGSGTRMVTVDASGMLASAPITGGGAAALNDLTDVNTSGAVNGSLIKYNGSSWVVGSDNVNDADASPTNELQTISRSGTTVTLSNGGGSVSIADNDNSASNEIQALSLSGNTLALTGGGSVNLAGYLDNTDAQTLSMNASTGNLSISGGNTVTASPWEFNDVGEVNLIQDTSEVHIGVDWNGWIGDKVWIRALNPMQNPLRVQIAPGITKFWVTKNGGVVIGTSSTTVEDNSLRVVQDATFGSATANSRVEIGNSEGVDRDTLLNINQNSSNASGVHYGVRVSNNPTTPSTSYAYYAERVSGGNGARYGFRNYMTGGTGIRYGFSSSIYADVANTSSVYGLFSYVSSSATSGTSYAGYFTNGTAGNSWSVYGSGNSYFTNVRIASTLAATGYELSVNGQIACEELLIDDSGSWPDYVFADDYELMPLDEFKASIEVNNHLPGMPSAKEVEENGILSGEMHKMTMEKVEELSLYIIELHERVKALERENAELKANK
jgi:hypothetical protein